jgi:hypothetical protein
MTTAFHVALFSFPLYVILHALIGHLADKSSFLSRATLLWGIFAFSFTLLMAQSAGMALLGAAFSFTLWGFYMLVLVHARNSVSLRMMDEIDTAGTLSLDELNARMSDEESVRARLKGLAEGGLLVQSGNSYSVTGKGRALGLAASVIRRIFSMDITG